MIRDARKRKTTHGDKDPNPRNKYNLAPETARVGYKYGKSHLGRYSLLIDVNVYEEPIRRGCSVFCKYIREILHYWYFLLHNSR